MNSISDAKVLIISREKQTFNGLGANVRWKSTWNVAGSLISFRGSTLCQLLLRPLLSTLFSARTFSEIHYHHWALYEWKQNIILWSRLVTGTCNRIQISKSGPNLLNFPDVGYFVLGIPCLGIQASWLNAIRAHVNRGVCGSNYVHILKHGHKPMLSGLLQSLLAGS